MVKPFKRIVMAYSNEVSLCSKYNSGANKQTEFELVKNKDNTKDSNMKQVIGNLVKFADFYSDNYTDVEDFAGFKDFFFYWYEYDMNNCLYDFLSNSLQNAIYNVQRAELSKEEKVTKYQEIFEMFIEEYKKMPITKNKEGIYTVSLISKSPIKDIENNPQNETTEEITKEKTSTMEKEEQLNVIQKAFDALITSLGLKKTETPAETQEETDTTIENKDVDPAKETTAEVQTPDVKVEEKVETEEIQVEEETIEKTKEAIEEVEETIEKSTEIAKELEEVKKQKSNIEQELEELKKSNEEKQQAIEKMSYIQKAKDEYSMLVGTPEEIGEKLYAISKSTLDDTVKEYILDQFKKVSAKNEELTKEVGSMVKNAGDMTDEEIAYAKAEEIAKAENISVQKALRKVKI